MFDRMKLRYVLEDWRRRYAVAGNDGMIDDLFREMEAFIEAVLLGHGLTEERAINYLRETGWLVRHDAAMSCVSLPDIVNAIMRNGDKTISVNVYPWKEERDG